MTTRLVALAATVSALVALGFASLAAQNASRTASAYTPPRTAWGDPDLQGVYTNSNEYATPLERPKEFEGKRLSDLSADDIARVRQQATKQAIAGLANGDVRGPDEWWLQILDLGKRNQPWLIVDPVDGHVPPLTPEAAQRLKGIRTKSSFLGGPFNGPDDLGMLERCISRSVPGSMIPVMYGNNYQIIQSPGLIVITYEIIHEARVIPLDGRPHAGAGVRTHMGDARGRWEAAHSSWRRRTSRPRRRIATPTPRHSASSSASRAWRRIASSGRQHSTIRRHGPNHGRSRCRSRPIRIRSFRSSATSTTTASETF